MENFAGTIPRARTVRSASIAVGSLADILENSSASAYTPIVNPSLPPLRTGSGLPRSAGPHPGGAQGGGALSAPIKRMPLELYLVRLSAPCRAVWLYLLQHDIPHTLHDVDFSTKGSTQSEFLNSLPHKEVPILIDGEVVVFEGPAILRYLATMYTHHHGFGLTFNARMLTESLLSWANSELHRVVGHHYAYPSSLNRYRLPSEQANETLIQHGLREMAEQLERLDKGYLSKGKYLTGERLTVADSYVATVLMQAEWVGFRFQLWPRVEAWLRRVRAQDYWGKVHSAHVQLVREVEAAPFEA